MTKKSTKAAQTLGRLGKGRKKTITAEDAKKRSDRLADARKKRWQHEQV